MDCDCRDISLPILCDLNDCEVTRVWKSSWQILKSGDTSEKASSYRKQSKNCYGEPFMRSTGPIQHPFGHLTRSLCPLIVVIAALLSACSESCFKARYYRKAFLRIVLGFNLIQTRPFLMLIRNLTQFTYLYSLEPTISQLRSQRFFSASSSKMKLL